MITSSVAAIYKTKNFPKQTHMTPDDWTDATADFTTAYERSKTLAERAAWDFQKAECPDLEIVTVNPGFVIGPSLVSCQFSSGDVIKKFMMKELPAIPYVQIPIVDVRDVAFAHL